MVIMISSLASWVCSIVSSILPYGEAYRECRMDVEEATKNTFYYGKSQIEEYVVYNFVQKF